MSGPPALEGMRVDLDEECFAELFAVGVVGCGKQGVGLVGEDAIVAGGMLRRGLFQARRHELGAPGCLEDVVGEAEQGLGVGGFEDETITDAEF